MKTVFIVYRWMRHEDSEVCAVFLNRGDAHTYCESRKGGYNDYYYDYDEWEVK